MMLAYRRPDAAGLHILPPSGARPDIQFPKDRARESTRARPALDAAALLPQPSEAAVTMEDRIEDRPRFEIALEKLEREVRAIIAEGNAANAKAIQKNNVLVEELQRRFQVITEAQCANEKSIRETRVELESQIKKIDDRVIQLDVKLTRKIDEKIDALHGKLSGEINALDTKLSGEINALDGKLSGEINALDRKLSGEINALDGKLSGEINALDRKLSGEINALDRKLSGEINALDTKLSGEINALDRKLFGELARIDGKLSGELARIAAHLGLEGASQSGARPPRRTTKRRKAR
jgi:hypothetical protein